MQNEEDSQHLEQENQSNQDYENGEQSQEEQQQENYEQEEEGEQEIEHSPEPSNHENIVDIKTEEQFNTPDNDAKEKSDEISSMASPEHKQSGKKSKNFIGNKNFVEMNLKVKTSKLAHFISNIEKEMQQEVNEKKRLRISQLSERKSQTSWMGSRMSVLGKEEGNSGLEWGKVSIRNHMLDRAPNQISYSKNQSQEFITKVSSSGSQATSLGQVFAQSRKEKAWHQTNASGINLMHSYKTLDMPAKSENDLVPQLLANVELKQNLNLKSQMDNHNYQNHDDVPSNYNSYQPKNTIVHNINNQHVQNMRMKTFTSNVF